MALPSRSMETAARAVSLSVPATRGRKPHEQLLCCSWGAPGRSFFGRGGGGGVGIPHFRRCMPHFPARQLSVEPAAATQPQTQKTLLRMLRVAVQGAEGDMGATDLAGGSADGAGGLPTPLWEPLLPQAVWRRVGPRGRQRSVACVAWVDGALQGLCGWGWRRAFCVPLPCGRNSWQGALVLVDAPLSGSLCREGKHQRG